MTLLIDTVWERSLRALIALRLQSFSKCLNRGSRAKIGGTIPSSQGGSTDDASREFFSIQKFRSGCYRILASIYLPQRSSAGVLPSFPSYLLKEL